MFILFSPVIARCGTVSLSNNSVTRILIIFKNTIDVRVNIFSIIIVSYRTTVKIATLHSILKGSGVLMSWKRVETVCTTVVARAMCPTVEVGIGLMPPRVATKRISVGIVACLSTSFSMSASSSGVTMTTTIRIYSILYTLNGHSEV